MSPPIPTPNKAHSIILITVCTLLITVRYLRNSF